MRPSIQLASGRFFDFQSFGLKDITIEDIASSTAKLCRFTGHCNALYTVGQHQLLVSRIVDRLTLALGLARETRRVLALAGLLHDATEAYINDLSRPLKLLVPAYGEYEHTRLWPAIAAKFDLPDVLPPVIKEADNIALITERRDLMPPAVDYGGEWDWAAEIKPLNTPIVAIEDWRTVRKLFLARYRNLTKERLA